MFYDAILLGLCKMLEAANKYAILVNYILFVIGTGPLVDISGTSVTQCDCALCHCKIE